MMMVMMMVMMIFTIISPRDPIAILKYIGYASANFPENVPVLGFMHFASLLLIIEISFEQSWFCDLEPPQAAGNTPSVLDTAPQGKRKIFN